MRSPEGAEHGGVGAGTGTPRLPVFVFPTELVFYSTQHSTHRRVLTLYNPYSFPLRFKILGTAPSLYEVIEAVGSVRARSCVDIVIRQRDVSQRHWGRRNRFRVDVWGADGQQGSREVWAELREALGGEEGQENPQRRARIAPTLPNQTSVTLYNHLRGGSPIQFFMYVVVGVVCVTVLMLPLHSEPSTIVPSHACVTVMQKLVCSYVLGETSGQRDAYRSNSDSGLSHSAHIHCVFTPSLRVTHCDVSSVAGG
ncbi:motile sperm domain-containing protein 1-like isoform X1 [Electrophorus electricus]|uniref:motile sperm domain-containing protein 1-like isoform X1 n=1 Tax=Electrophorus electricus TaxID=8005 RepID=UPI0015CF87A8|nr:motile sperm domain-containing protein 1-like isoform X1 [Electrophorus electricus]XP_035377474.1 motile sperm domain-containing protein 1-like isoform X1 [Electrophorus electricus]